MSCPPHPAGLFQEKALFHGSLALHSFNKHFRNTYNTLADMHTQTTPGTPACRRQSLKDKNTLTGSPSMESKPRAVGILYKTHCTPCVEGSEEAVL